MAIAIVRKNGNMKMEMGEADQPMCASMGTLLPSVTV